MNEQQIRKIVREEIVEERISAVNATPIGQVTKEFMDLMKRNNLTFREATLIFRDARKRVWPSLEDRA